MATCFTGEIETMQDYNTVPWRICQSLGPYCSRSHALSIKLIGWQPLLFELRCPHAKHVLTGNNTVL